jgi:uncharacterized protein (TIGR02145 family)
MMKLLILITLLILPLMLRAQCLDLDGKSYKTLMIAEMQWTAENLQTSKFRNGDLIPETKSSEEWVQYCQENKAACCYLDNDPTKGKLYNWFAVNDPRGLAPEGWHVANDAEWADLARFYGGWKIAGKKMKALPKRKKKKAEQPELFNAVLPTGMRYLSGAFEDNGKSYWWSSTPKDYEGAGFRWISDSSDVLNSDICNKRTGYSVRCVKN